MLRTCGSVYVRMGRLAKHSARARAPVRAMQTKSHFGIVAMRHSVISTVS